MRRCKALLQTEISTLCPFVLSIQVKHFRCIDCLWAPVSIRWHDIAHVRPPFLDDLRGLKKSSDCSSTQRRATSTSAGLPASATHFSIGKCVPPIFGFDFNVRKQLVTIRVQEDTVIMSTGIDKLLRKLGPNLIVPLLVLCFLAFIDTHNESLADSSCTRNMSNKVSIYTCDWGCFRANQIGAAR